MIISRNDRLRVNGSLLTYMLLMCLFWGTACTSSTEIENSAAEIETTVPPLPTLDTETEDSVIELETAVLQQSTSEPNTFSSNTAASIGLSSQPIISESQRRYAERYGVTKEILDLQATDTKTEITIRVYVDERWNMAEFTNTTPPSNVLMHSLDFPRLTDQEGISLPRPGVSSTPLQQDEHGQLYTDMVLTFEGLNSWARRLSLDTNIEFHSVRSQEPLLIDLSGRDFENGEEWELDKVVQIGGVSYRFNRARLTSKHLELFSDGIEQAEEGFHTISFYTMAAPELSAPAAFANGASGIFDDPAVPLSKISLLSIDQPLDGEIELYFRASIQAIAPYRTEIRLSDYDLTYTGLRKIASAVETTVDENAPSTSPLRVHPGELGFIFEEAVLTDGASILEFKIITPQPDINEPSQPNFTSYTPYQSVTLIDDEGNTYSNPQMSFGSQYIGTSHVTLSFPPLKSPDDVSRLTLQSDFQMFWFGLDAPLEIDFTDKECGETWPLDLDISFNGVSVTLQTAEFDSTCEELILMIWQDQTDDNPVYLEHIHLLTTNEDKTNVLLSGSSSHHDILTGTEPETSVMRLHISERPTGPVQFEGTATIHFTQIREFVLELE